MLGAVSLLFELHVSSIVSPSHTVLIYAIWSGQNRFIFASLVGLPNHSVDIRIRSSVFDIRYSIRSNIRGFVQPNMFGGSIFDNRTDSSSNRFDRSNICIFDGTNLFDSSVFDRANL